MTGPLVMHQESRLTISAIEPEAAVLAQMGLRNLCYADLGDSRPRRQRIRSLRDNADYRAANGRGK